MRIAIVVITIAALATMCGCGVIHDMRSEYVANRALSDARAELLSASPRKDKALADLDLAYRARSHDPRFLERLAGPYQSAGNFARALECYEAAAQRTGEGHDAGIGYCLLKLGEKERGVALLERVLKVAMRAYRDGEMSPRRYASVLNDAGYALIDADMNVEGALELVEEAVRIDPLVPPYIDSLGWAYYRLGEYRDAAFHLERAARLWNRDDPEILWHLGAVHAHLAQFRRAESELKQALALDPANSEARAMLRDLLRELPPPTRV